MNAMEPVDLLLTRGVVVTQDEARTIIPDGDETRRLEETERIHLGNKVKSVLLEGKSTLLVFAEEESSGGEAVWRTCTKQQLRPY